MLWGTFGIVHLTTLLLSAGMILGLWLFLKKRSDRTATIVLALLSLTGIAAIVFNLIAWNSPLEYLPFHLCSLTAMALPFAVFTRSKILNNLLLLWGLGAILAVVLNQSQANYEVFSWTFVFYYFPHTFEFGVILLTFLLRRVKLDWRCTFSTIGITFAVYTLVHFLNLAINAYCIEHQIVDWAGEVVQVNYMYSLVAENPVLQMMYTKPYWYMFGMIPVMVVYLGLIYAPQIILLLKNRKQKTK